MDVRKKMLLRLRSGELTVTQAAKEFQVSRSTVYTWLHRSQETGIEELSEKSRRPLSSPRKTSEDLEFLLLWLKDKHPTWGAPKLCQVMARDFGLELSVSTGERILKRHNLVRERGPSRALQTFEREAPNMLYQIDFKGLPKRLNHALLTVVDDASRMCLHLGVLDDKTGESVFAALWKMFAVTGLPECFLMDNGDCWGTFKRRCPTAFEARLWRLGIRTTHSRPAHPQTQGKVERLHRTIKEDLGARLLDTDRSRLQRACDEFRNTYNWVRPHGSLDMRVPGSVYLPSPRLRPSKEPAAKMLDGMESRLVGESGGISYKGRHYKLGKGLAGEYVQIAKDHVGLRTYYAGFPMIYLEETTSY